jgi:hypothetical protein
MEGNMAVPAGKSNLKKTLAKGGGRGMACFS